MSKYSIGVWECTFYKSDADGNELKNVDGSIKIFKAPKLDMSHIAEYVDEDDLTDEQKEVVEVKFFVNASSREDAVLIVDKAMNTAKLNEIEAWQIELSEELQ
jgi:hypothetical protein